MKYFFGLIALLTASSTALSQIRDVASITASTDGRPFLVVIDGKVLPKLVKSKNDSTKLVDPLNEVDINDIEKIDVLKNEAAVALYGVLGENGVVMITTKSFLKKSKKQ